MSVGAVSQDAESFRKKLYLTLCNWILTQKQPCAVSLVKNQQVTQSAFQNDLPELWAQGCPSKISNILRFLDYSTGKTIRTYWSRWACCWCSPQQHQRAECHHFYLSQGVLLCSSPPKPTTPSSAKSKIIIISKSKITIISTTAFLWPAFFSTPAYNSWNTS